MCFNRVFMFIGDKIKLDIKEKAAYYKNLCEAQVLLNDTFNFNDPAFTANKIFGHMPAALKQGHLPLTLAKTVESKTKPTSFLSNEETQTTINTTKNKQNKKTYKKNYQNKSHYKGKSKSPFECYYCQNDICTKKYHLDFWEKRLKNKN